MSIVGLLDSSLPEGTVATFSEDFSMTQNNINAIELGDWRDGSEVKSTGCFQRF